MKWRLFWPWLQRMTEVKVDFVVDLSGDGMAVYYRLAKSPYNMSEGPLWRVRLVPLEDKSPGNGRHHQAILVLTFQHIITDALTNLVVSREILRVLNAEMLGREYQCPYRGLTPAMSDEMIDWRTCWRFALGFSFSTVRSIASFMFNRNNVYNILPRARARPSVLKILQEDLTLETTQQLLRRCKEAQVTVNCCFTAAANLAMFHSAQKLTAVELESVKLTVDQAVNLRRCYDSIYQECTGVHVSLEKQEHVIDNRSTTKEGFWSLARSMQKKLHHNLNVTQAVLKTQILGTSLGLFVPINYFLTRCGLRNLTYVHMDCNNMGNLKHLLPGKYGDGPVEIGRFLRTMTDEYVGSPCTVFIQTFEGRCLLSLDYFTNRMTDEVANQFFSLLTRYITLVAQYGYIRTVDNEDITAKN